MVEAMQYMILGLMIGGPIALVGGLMWLTSFYRDLPTWHTWKQREEWFRSPRSVRGIVFVFVGLFIVVLGMIPFLLL